MTKKTFDKIAAGLDNAIAIAHGEKVAPRVFKAVPRKELPDFDAALERAKKRHSRTLDYLAK